ncbi:hypothetical protein ACSSS7_006456 [Eimeria intestinalis]
MGRHIYCGFADAAGSPSCATPARKDFWTECSRFFLARASLWEHEVELWKDISEYESEVPLERNSIGFVMASLSILGGTTGTRQDPGEGEDTERAPEPAVGSPTPLSLGGTGEGDSGRHMAPPPSPGRLFSRAPLRLDGNFGEFIFGWEITSLRSWWCAVTSARDLRDAHMAFEQYVAELKWLESLGLRAAAEQLRRDGTTFGIPATFGGVADRPRPEFSPERPVSVGAVAGLFRPCPFGGGRFAALLGYGRAALREYLLGVQRTGGPWSRP